MHNYSFGISTSEQFHNLFIESTNDFFNDVLNIRKAIGVAMFAWHLTDWLYQEKVNLSGKKFNKEELGKFRKKLGCESLFIMHDIINGSKHFVLGTGRDKAVEDTAIYNGDFDPNDYDHGDFDVSSLRVILKNGMTVDFLNEVKKIKTFWANYFIKKPIQKSKSGSVI